MDGMNIYFWRAPEVCTRLTGCLYLCLTFTGSFMHTGNRNVLLRNLQLDEPKTKFHVQAVSLEQSASGVWLYLLRLFKCVY